MKAFTQALAATALLATTVSSQQQYTIDPNSVSSSLRDFWCQQQIAQCPLICLQTAGNTDSTQSNDCTASDLTYSCVCDNGISPNVSEYSQTLPFFICQEWGTQCVSNCGNGNTACQSACTADHPCGAQNPTRQNTSTLSKTMSNSAQLAAASASSDGIAAGSVITSDGVTQTLYGLTSKGADSSNAVSHVRVWALSAGQTFGTMALIGGLIGGFAVLL